MLSYRDFVSNLPRRPAIVAHRGAWHAAPENSLAAIEAAADAGYEIVEIDVQRSADGQMFLMHDDTLTRMTGREEMARHLPMTELAKLGLRPGDGSGSGAPTGHRIPTLAEALDLARGRVYLDIDVKHRENMEAAAAVIEQAGMGEQVDIKIPVRRIEDVSRLHALQDQFGVMVMPMARITEEKAPAMVELLARSGAGIVEIEFDRIETLSRHRAALDSAGVTRWVNTLTPVANGGFTDAAALEDPDAVWGALLTAGVEVFQTDEPEALARWRKEMMDGQEEVA